MSKCEFTIEVDREDATYVPGEHVRGRVHFRANEDFEHRRILLVREWRTHGRGNRDSGGKAEIELESGGMCRAGDTDTFVFDVVMPPGPYTQHGHLLNVDWYIEARADIARAIDPKGECEIVLVPGEHATTEYFMGDVALAGATDTIDKAARLQRTVQTVVFGSVAAFLLLFGIFNIVGSGLLTGSFDSNNAGGLIIGALLFVPGAWLGFRQVRNTLSRQRLGAIALDISPREVEPGGTVQVRLHSASVTDATIEAAKLTLLGKEIVVRGTGTDRTTHTHVLHEQEVQLIDLPQAVRQGPLELGAEVALPIDAAYSFRSSDNRVTWTLAARLSLAGWPDWHEDIELIVRP